MMIKDRGAGPEKTPVRVPEDGIPKGVAGGEVQVHQHDTARFSAASVDVTEIRQRWKKLRVELHPYGRYDREEDALISCGIDAARTGRRQSCLKVPGAKRAHANSLARRLDLPVYFRPSGEAGGGRYTYAEPGHRPGEYNQPEMHQHDMIQLGQDTWARFHKTAEDFRVAVGDACGCGVHAEQAMRGWHDAVNVRLGKSPHFPDDLRSFSQFMQQACKKMDHDILGHPVPPPDDDEDEDDFAGMSQAQMEASVYEIVTEKIIAALQRGTVPWRKPWSAKGESWMPQNAISHRPYSGINFILLQMSGYEDPRWLTFKQAKGRGGSVKKGEKSTLVVFWKIEETTNDAGEKQNFFLLRYYNIFNVEQCDGLNLKPIKQPGPDFDPIKEAEAIIEGMPKPPRLDYHGGDRAYYIPSKDEVHLPARAAFKAADEFYSTAFHELGHSTGHEDRLDRFSDEKEEGPAVFGSPVYSREELVAEFCSAFLCATAGIDSTRENSAAYINSWIRRLREDPRLVITAASRGQKAADYILGNLKAEEEVSASQNPWIDFILGGARAAVAAAGATIGASVISRAISVPALTSPEAAIRVVDDRKSDPSPEGTVQVYDPGTLDGDQAQVDIGSLLNEIEGILKNPSKQGEINPETLKVLKGGA